jgi:hypothetical protein
VTFHIPADQSNSWNVFWQHVVNDASITGMGYTAADCQPFKTVAERRFDAGEPIWSVALEIKSLIDDNGTVDRPVYRLPETARTPLQLAKRVVRI